MEITKINMEEDQPLVENYKLSEFRVETLTTESLKKLQYKNERIFLDEAAELMLVSDPGEASVTKAITIHKNHFKVFQIISEEDKNTKIEYQFSSYFKIPELGNGSKTQVKYQYINGAGHIYFFSYKQCSESRISSYLDFKIFFINLKKVTKTDKTLTQVLIDKLKVKRRIATTFDRIIKSLEIRTPTHKAWLFFAREIEIDVEETKPYEDQGSHHPYTIKVCRVRLNNGREPRSEVVLQLFEDENLGSIKTITRAIQEAGMSKSDRQFVTKNSKFTYLRDMNLYARGIKNARNSSTISCFIQIEQECINMRIVDLTNKKLLKSAILTSFEVCRVLWKDLRFQATHYPIEDIYYDFEADRLEIIIKMNLKSIVRDYRSCSKFEVESFSSQSKNKSKTIRDLFKIEVSFFSNTAKREIKWLDISGRKVHQQGMAKRPLMSKFEKDGLNVLIPLDKKPKIGETQQDSFLIKLSDINFSSSWLDKNNILKAGFSENGALILGDNNHLYTIDPKTGKVEDSIRYCHCLDLSAISYNACFEGELMLVSQLRGYYLELFQIDKTSMELKFMLDIDFGLDAGNFQIESIRFFKLNPVTGSYLVGFYLIEKDLEPGIESKARRYLNILEISPDQAKVVKRGKIDLKPLRDQGFCFEFELDRKGSLAWVANSSLKVSLQFFNSDFEPDREIKPIEYELRANDDKMIEGAMFKQGNLYLEVSEDEKAYLVIMKLVKADPVIDGEIRLEEVNRVDLEKLDLLESWNPEGDSLLFYVFHQKNEPEAQVGGSNRSKFLLRMLDYQFQKLAAIDFSDSLVRDDDLPMMSSTSNCEEGCIASRI